METPSQQDAPVIKLTKSGRPRKPYVMAQARKEAFEQCKVARLAKQAAPAAASAGPVLARVQLAKDQAKRIDSAMGITEEIEAVPASSSRAGYPARCCTG
jgi:hypothetical protein